MKKLLVAAMPLFLVAAMWPTGSSARPPQVPAPPPKIVSVVTLTGAQSAIDTVGYHRLRSREELAKVWLQHSGKPAEGDYSFFYNEAGVPEVDFVGHEVLAVFGGRTWNSAGFKLEEVLDEAGRRVVHFDHKAYQTAGPDGGGKRAKPFAFFVLPRCAKPIVLEENVQSMIGKEPVWKEQARLE